MFLETREDVFSCRFDFEYNIYTTTVLKSYK